MTTSQSSAKFCMSTWSTALRAASECFKSNLEVEALCAFGFELIGDRSFLKKTLRRLNCLVGVRHSATLPASFEVSYALLLLRCLERLDRALFDAVAAVKIKRLLTAPNIDSIMLRRHAPEYKCAEDDRIVILSFRWMDNDIWTEYVDDILSRLEMLTTDFRDQRPPRNRFYQLYLIYEALFGQLIPPITNEQEQLRRFLAQTDNSIQRTYDSPANRASHPGMVSYPWEEMVITRLIVPRMRLIAAAIAPEQGEQPVVLALPSRAGSEGASTVLSGAAYATASAYIRASYEEFHFGDGTSPAFAIAEALGDRLCPEDVATRYIDNVVVRSRVDASVGQASASLALTSIRNFPSIVTDGPLGLMEVGTVEVGPQYFTAILRHRGHVV